jgi:hypothetical protein
MDRYSCCVARDWLHLVSSQLYNNNEVTVTSSSLECRRWLMHAIKQRSGQQTWITSMRRLPMIDTSNIAAQATSPMNFRPNDQANNRADIALQEAGKDERNNAVDAVVVSSSLCFSGAWLSNTV